MDIVSHGTGSIVAFAPHRRVKAVGVKSFDVQFSKVPFSDAEGSFSQTWSQEGFVNEFNSKHPYLSCSVKDGVFTCAPRIDQYGSEEGPDGFYLTHDCTVDGSGVYTAKVKLDYSSLDYDTRYSLIQTAPVLYANFTALATGRDFPTTYVRPYTTVLDQVNVLGTSDTPKQRITIDFSNENNRLLLSTPLFVYADRDYFKEHIVKPYNEFVQSSRMAFRLRAHELHDKHNLTEHASSIPADTTELTFFSDNSSFKGRVVYRTQSAPGVDQDLVDSPAVTGQSATWFMLDIDNVGGMWQTAAQRFSADVDSTNDYMLSCAFDYAADGTIFESRGIKVVITGSVLFVNGVSTGLTVAKGQYKVLTIVKTSVLDVNIQNFGAAEQDYDTVPLLETYTDNSSTQNINVGAGVTFGSWIYSRNITPAFVTNARSLVYTHTFGLVPNVVLGTLNANGSFSNNPNNYAWNSATNELVEFQITRVRPELTQQQQNIMRIPSQYVFESTTANEPSYTKRVRQADFYLQGIQGEALLLSAHLPEDYHQIETPHLRDAISHKTTNAEYHIMCQDNQDLHFKDLLPASANVTIVSSLLLV